MFGFVFIDAVIVAGNCARSDINLFAELGIANIAEVIYFTAIANNGFFGFNKIAHFGVLYPVGCQVVFWQRARALHGHQLRRIQSLYWI